MKERQKDIQSREEIQAFSEVSKLHTSVGNNETTETEETKAAGTFAAKYKMKAYVKEKRRKLDEKVKEISFINISESQKLCKVFDANMKVPLF